jgi:hypothetical protein
VKFSCLGWLLLLAWISARTLAAGDATDGVDADHPFVSLPAFPAQLLPGSKPGTFRFSMPVLVKFSQKSEFPVDLVLENYAHREVFRQRIPDSSAHIITCALKPGSYSKLYKMTGAAKTDYQNFTDFAPTIFITLSGRQGSYVGSNFFTQPLHAYQGPSSFDAVFRRKIELLSPKPKTVISGKSIHFQWKPIEGVKEYSIYVCPIQDQDHPDSGFPAEYSAHLSKGSNQTLRIGLDQDEIYLQPGNPYFWSVQDGNIDGTTQSGRIARSSGRVFIMSGHDERTPGYAPRDFMRDEALEPRLGIRLQQPYITSDGGDGVLSVNVLYSAPISAWERVLCLLIK